MTKRTKFVVGGLLLLGAAALAFSLLREPHEPSFEGKPLGQWLVEFDEWDGSSNAPVVIAVNTMGTNGIAYLVHQIGKTDSRFTRFLCSKPFLVWLASRLHLHLDPNAAAMDRQRAYGAFFVLGAQGETAIPGLTRLLMKPQTASSAAIALAHIGTNTIPILEAAATSSNSSVRSGAIVGLSVFGAQAEHSASLLIKALDDQHYYVRACAAGALGRLGPGDRQEIAAHLIPALTDSHPHVRANAAISLGILHESSDNILAALSKACDDPDNGVRSYATNSLHQLTPKRSE
jgi:HEAT repeat protein